MNNMLSYKMHTSAVLCGLFFLLLSCSKKDVNKASSNDKWQRASLEIENSLPAQQSNGEILAFEKTNSSESISESEVGISDAMSDKPSLSSIKKTSTYVQGIVKEAPVVSRNEKSEKKSISKKQLVKQIKAVSSNVKTGLILILVGLGISLLLGALLGGLFYTIGGVVIVVGIVFLILGILGV